MRTAFTATQLEDPDSAEAAAVVRGCALWVVQCDLPDLSGGLETNATARAGGSS